MSTPKDNVSLLKNVSGLDITEIKIEQSINEMVAVVRKTHSDKKKEYLLNEINYRQRQLYTLRKEKGKLN